MSANQLDVDVKVIIIRGPKNSITIGPALRQFSVLQVLRITESNLPAIGAESFWGLKYLRILGECNQLFMVAVLKRSSSSSSCSY